MSDVPAKNQQKKNIRKASKKLPKFLKSPPSLMARRLRLLLWWLGQQSHAAVGRSNSVYRPLHGVSDLSHPLSHSLPLTEESTPKRSSMSPLSVLSTSSVMAVVSLPLNLFASHLRDVQIVVIEIKTLL
ncbi:hypothetical protein Droror1_Dr00006230 [Drosera rotundifolia]